MADSSDWRLQGQDKYLKGVTLVRRPYRRYQKNPNWDHDHCSFCWATFTLLEGEPDAVHEGYATADDYHWVCESCYNDFKDLFQWRVIRPDDVAERAQPAD